MRQTLLSLLRQCRAAAAQISSEAAILAGAVTGALFPVWGWLAGAAAFFLPRSRSVWFLAGLFGAIFSVLVGQKLLPGDFSHPFLGRGGQAEFELELADRRMSAHTGVDPLWRVSARMRRLILDGKALDVSGKILCESSLPLPRKYGSILKGNGLFTPPEEGSFSPLWHLRIDRFTNEGVQPGWRTSLFRLRDLLLERTLSGIRNDTDRNLAAAFFFGVTSGLTPERKADFAAAGTIHLFAVSGLHVGLLAALLMGIFALVPFKLRHFSAAALIFLYVLLTGAAIPAVRAGFMLIVFLCARGMLFRVVPLRLLMLAGAAVILGDPGAVKEAGFQYSFIITGVLLAYSRQVKECWKMMSREYLLMPDSVEKGKKERRFRRAFGFWALMGSCLAAFAAGSAVSLFHFGTITAVAAAANPLTLPVLSFLFILLPLKILFCGISFCNTILAGAIELVFDYLRNVASAAASLQRPFYCGIPSCLECIFLGLLLFAALLCKRRSLRLLCAGLFCFFLVSFPVRAHFASPEIIVLASDSRTPPAVVIFPPSDQGVVVINPSLDAEKKIEELLSSHGAEVIDTVTFSSPTVRATSGLPRLLRRFPVNRVTRPDPRRGDWQFLSSIEVRSRREKVSFYGQASEKWKILPENKGFAIEYRDIGVMLSWSLQILSGNDGCHIIYLSPAGRKEEKTLAWSCPGELWRIKIGDTP